MSIKPVSEVRIEYAGEIVDIDAAPVTRAFLAGLLRDVSARVNVVNAFLIAEERGIKVTTTYIRSGGRDGSGDSHRNQARANQHKVWRERSLAMADSDAKGV